MSKRENYNTKQKELILNIIKRQQSEFTIKDIYEETKDVCGLTTIYRLVDKLCANGILNKSIDKNNITKYSYLEECHHENHFYLKCNNCGNLIHIDCDCIKELINHIYNEHNFRMSQEHIIINGICQECMKGMM